MALSASDVTNGRGVIDRKNITPCGVVNSVVRSAQQVELQVKNKRAELRRVNSRPILAATLGPSNPSLSNKYRTRGKHVKHGSSLLSCSAGMPDTETEESVRHHSGSRGVYRQGGDDPYKSNCSTVGLSYACKFVYNDANFVNERARNDIFLLSCGIRRWDARARQDVAILGLEFLKIDARAREDTEKIDRGVKEKAERLHHIGTKLKEKAQTRLKSVAEKHWNDGALKADLRRADLRAKQRAMEDALMALEFVKNIHNMMLSKVYNFPLNEKQDSVITGGNLMERIMLEKNGINLDFTEVSADRILAVEEAYWSIASALYDADGIDYTDPEDLELLVTTLIDLDAMDGKSSVSLLAECSSSPDVNTRKALANALAAAPSMWTLGNAGMGALQRLAEDSHPAIAAAASKAIYELKKQWEIAEGDSWRFTMNQDPPLEDSKPESDTVVDE